MSYNQVLRRLWRRRTLGLGTQVRSGMAQLIRLVLLAFLMTVVNGAIAPAEQGQAVTAAQRAWDAAIKAATKGPADIPLRELATVHLQDAYAFVPPVEAA